MIEPQILFEDDSILVINKPCGMIVNNADSVKDQETVQNWAASKIGIERAKSQERNQVTSSKSQVPMTGDQRLTTTDSPYDIVEEFHSRGGIVHRLDKETSGVLVIAKTPEAFGFMKNQFQSRTTQKTYIALAHGKITPEEGIIDAPTGRLPYNRTHFGVIAGGREAVTRYRTISNYVIPSKRSASRDPHEISRQARDDNDILTLVELEPKTGRTHQIRVHLKHIGHPIFSDELYAGRKTARDDRKLLSRLFLHAKSLTFQNPHGDMQTVEAPLPEELASFLGSLEPVVSSL